jgi:Leucine-rich repeat (LRR) protein
MEVVDSTRLKKLRMRIDMDDPVYPRMKKLKVRGKDLGRLPHEIFHIGELEVLDLSPERESCLYYRLTEIPPEIGRLTNLRVLMLDTNEISEIPPEVCLLTGLERVSLSNNRLKDLPDAFASLTQIRSLHISNNEFEKFPLPVLDLPMLQFLDLADNELTELPEAISKLQGLHTLILFINKLSTLPDSICNLPSLRCLWIGNNNITRLPRNFGKLKHLDWGFRHTQSTVIDGNPMGNPPLDVCKRGVEAIARYFQQAAR